MPAITSTLITLTAQIVNVLCGKSLTFDALLARLQSKYPTSSWTSTLLTNTLAAAKTLGTIKFLGGFAGSTVVTGYAVNPEALQLNNAFNKHFQCSDFRVVSCCSALCNTC